MVSRHILNKWVCAGIPCPAGHQQQWLCRVWLPIFPPCCSTQETWFRKHPPKQWPDSALVHCAKADQTQFYWWSFTGVQVSGSLPLGKVGENTLDVLMFVQIESGSLLPPARPWISKISLPSAPWGCSEGNGFREEKGLLGESVNTNDLRTAALQRRLAARGLLQWGSVLWRHKRDKELRG